MKKKSKENPIEDWKTRQEILNEKNDSFYKTLNKEDQKKIDAIGEAMRILTENKVATLMFCSHKHYNTNGEEAFVQYNNSGILGQTDKNFSIQDYWHNSTLGIYGYVVSLLKFNAYSNFRIGDLFESWFWSYVKPEYREAAKKKTEERQSNKIPAQ